MFTDDMVRLKTRLAQQEISQDEFHMLVRRLIEMHVGTGSSGKPTTTLTQEIKKLSIARLKLA